MEDRRIHFAEERRIHSLVAEEEAGSSGIHCCRRSIATLRLGSPWLWGGVCLFARTDMCFIDSRRVVIARYAMRQRSMASRKSDARVGERDNRKQS